MTAPVTTKLEGRFRAHGLDPAQHQGLIADLMRVVYDEKEQAVDEVIGTAVNRRMEAFAEAVDQFQTGVRDDLDALWHARYVDSARTKEDNNA